MIKERIIELIELKGIPKEKFYLQIGMTSANFRGKAKERPLNSNTIENIISVIPDVNIEWLLTGKGEKLKSKKKDNQKADDRDQYIIELQKEKIERLGKKIDRLKKELESKNGYNIAAETDS